MILFLSMLALATPPVSSAARDSAELAAAGHKRYPSEHGRIVYALSGTASGTQVITFDRWGWRERQAMEVIVALGDMQLPPIHTTTWMDGTTVTTQDGATGVATRMENPAFGDLDDAAPLDPATAAVQAGMRKGATRTLLGRACDEYTLEDLGTTVCLWDGVPLQSTTRLGGLEVQLTATEVDFQYVPDAATLVVPADVTAMDAAPAGIGPSGP